MAHELRYGLLIGAEPVIVRNVAKIGNTRRWNFLNAATFDADQQLFITMGVITQGMSTCYKTVDRRNPVGNPGFY